MKVLVTGASGHVGFALTHLLVDKGYEVRAAMRGSADEEKSAPLRSLGVEVVEADILDRAAMEHAMAGVEGLFHVAAVYRMVVEDPERDLIRPALEGAENALRAAKRAGVRRVVLTSSTVAVGADGKGRPLTEDDWNDDAVNPYARAKTLAERRAWEVADDLGLDLVCINPSGVLGPYFYRHTPTTLPLHAMLRGEYPLAPPMSMAYVDVRDVATAHLLAFENPAAQGRYIASTETHTMAEVGRAINELAHTDKAPTRTMPMWMMSGARLMDWASHKMRGTPRMLSAGIVEEFANKSVEYDNTRIRSELDWSPTPFEQTLPDTLRWITEKRPATW